MELTVFRQPAKHRLIVHLVNYQSAALRVVGARIPQANNIPQEILPVHDIEVAIRFAEHDKIKDIYFAPDGEKAAHTIEEDRIKLRVPELKIHRMIVVEYA